MGVATNIVLADAAGTPVNHTFVPLGVDIRGVQWFEEQTAISPLGFYRISMALTRPPMDRTPGLNSKERTQRAKIVLWEPVLETLSNDTSSGISPAPTIAYVPAAFTDYVISERATLRNRQDLRKMNGNLQSDANVVTLVETLTLNR